MLLDTARVRRHLKDFDFETLFIEDLGWNHYDTSISVPVDAETITLDAVAEKCGMAVFCCPPLNDGRIPDHATRLKIERQVAKSVFQHIIVYFDEGRTTQYWQWVKRETGKPMACRESQYHRNQPGDALIQKLQSIAFSIDEEETLTHVDVTNRVRAAFDVEKVTKRFYDRFKTEHDAFLKFIGGIPEEGMQRWYVSVMLNRLMFIYFIQKKGFLNNDQDYLRTKLAQIKTDGKDRFYSEFLCPLFFEGFSKQESQRSTKSLKILGIIPYLNGGLFSRHQIEELHGKHIRIPDSAFERIFDFFDQYHWHLDERPLRADNEINPDVLGYIFEKYINQKQMGAYYSKEDITEYISKNTVIPFLLDSTMQKCKIAFECDQSMWKLLQNDPDRYIHRRVDQDGRLWSPLKKGVELPLPSEIAIGLTDVERRNEWNNSASSDYGLPTEIWREVVARRKQYETVHTKLANGEIREISDLITYNLDILQFAQDIIENCEGPEVLHAFYHAIERVTILDPTCGSGAFLFAALNVLEPLYEACLDRMEAFVAEGKPEKFVEFRNILESVAKRPNRRYFILKSIILNNLFGVDIMEEAIEICKLRLFLKLVAQIEKMESIEPLPDIDFNVRTGNSLIGFATQKEVEKTLSISTDGSRRLFWNDDDEAAIKRIKADAQKVSNAFHRFCQIQMNDGFYDKEFEDSKHELINTLKVLEKELNYCLAREYNIDANREGDYNNWLDTHKPFHWFIEFYSIINNGGFDVIIGNPPYLELREVEYTPINFEHCEHVTIHAMCIERSLKLLNIHGCMSMIVPLALVSTQRMEVVQGLLEEQRNAWYANYSWRPGKLFDTVNRALTIFVVTPSKNGRTFSTNYQKWTSDNRSLLFLRIKYAEVPRNRSIFWVPKLGDEIEISILKKCLDIQKVLNNFIANSGHRVYYRTTGGLYWKVFTDFPPAFKVNGISGHSTRETSFSLSNRNMVRAAIAILSSDLFWWWYTITTNCRDLNPSDIQNFPIPELAIIDPRVIYLGEIYLKDLQNNSTMQQRNQIKTGRTETQSFKIQKSKAIISDIDRTLAEHYHLTEEELDFIINYDIKYRMGLGSEEVDE